MSHTRTFSLWKTMGEGKFIITLLNCWIKLHLKATLWSFLLHEQINLSYVPSYFPSPTFCSKTI